MNAPVLDTDNPKYLEEFYSMCMTWRHDYGLLDEMDRLRIQRQLSQLFNHHVLPLLIKLDK